jgi:DNA (cytosine-5)-methyltransferase 1
MSKNIWDSSVPVEKSAYIDENNINILNSNLKLENKPKMIDLFSGAGGFSVGCEWAGFQSVLGTDYLEPAMETWSKNHPNAISVLGDIKNIDPEFLDELLSNCDINLITGGVPCQGFSRSNRKHNPNDDRNFLYKEYLKMVEYFKPEFILLENVQGMKETANGKFVDNILNDLKSHGYNATVQLFNAADFGVPQNRKRIIFIGAKNHNLEFKIKGNFKRFQKQTSLFNSKSDNYYRTVLDAISDLPELKASESLKEYTKDAANDYQKFMRGISNDLDEHKLDYKITKNNSLYNHDAPNHQKRTIKRIKNTEPGSPMYERFKQRIRLDPNEPSPTQLAGGIRPQFQFGHPTQNRGLTVRERARIQSFPDNYRFYGGMVQGRVQTGNAVPPLLIYNIAKEIIKKL